MSRSPSLPDRPHREIDPDLPDDERFEALRGHFADLVDVHEQLEGQLEDAENRRQRLQERVDRVERENETLKSSSLYIATVEDVIDDGEVVVKQHGNNQEVLTEVSPRMAERVTAGDRVAVNDSFAIQTVLEAETDARAQSMEITERPSVGYEDIGGIDEQIREVREAVEQPLIEPELFEEVGIDPPSGVLLYGPPGTGKTMLAKAVANKTDATFIKMAGSELVRKFIGEGSRLVRDLFEMAREREPAIIFIDEIDAIAATRTESKTSGDAEVQRTMMQLLAEMDGFEARGEIRIIAATNRFDMLDRAILRPGRFDRLIEVPEPNRDGREQIFEIHTRGMNVTDDVDFDTLADDTEGYSGADIESLATEAGMFAIRNEREEIRHQDFLDAVEKVENDDSSDVVSSAGYFYQ
ncbi:AAA family ATPase [Natrarchaeobius halalkaliphilus]|uniref:Proteasome-activating nucleotidase n=1 Tax=Natrarchaeobius halalkaliphilus TaxID=1679091 RepID=A0A3N6LJX2_9EURY|nr:proteasome-activating nucleotidase [Natrarchaeobius halalkaliphilus]RQG89073.1 AAA family ATPase [Natrarchaeobius halalkaliphilus]